MSLLRSLKKNQGYFTTNMPPRRGLATHFNNASGIKNALAEAKRGLRPGGKLAAMTWRNKEACETYFFLATLASTLWPPPYGAEGPFALTENHLLEGLLVEVSFAIIENNIFFPFGN